MTERDTAQRVEAALLAIVRHWQPTPVTPRGPTSGPRPALGSRTPVPAGALSLRREAADLLAFLARVVCDQRDLRCDVAAHDTRALARWLAPHAEWLAAHGVDPESEAAELTRIARALRDLATGARPTDVVLGPCPADDSTGRPCGGIVTTTIRPDGETRAVHCSVDPESHAWPSTHWDLLGRVIADTRATRDWLPIDDASVVTGVPASTIRRWIAQAQLDTVRTTGRRRPVTLVSVADVDATRAALRHREHNSVYADAGGRGDG